MNGTVFVNGWLSGAKRMKKAIWVMLITIGFIGSSKGQMAISGGIFAENPTRFNGRMITVKNIRLNLNSHNSVPGTVPPVNPPGGNANNTPIGGVGSNIQRCNPPRGFKMLDVEFIEKPEFESCFFIAESMYNQLKKETLGQGKVDVQLTFRGDNRTGYNVMSYRLGR